MATKRGKITGITDGDPRRQIVIPKVKKAPKKGKGGK